MIQNDVKEAATAAMRARDQQTLTTLRGLSAAFTNELVTQHRKPDEALSDEDAITIIRREVKKRKEAAEAFENAGRTESAEKERAEQAILETYLPAQMSEEDIAVVVKKKQEELGITDKKDMGRLMGAIMQELKGKADGDLVKKVVESVL
ncbi:MAG: GatB/YqeY domain-containing protein [Patescibacteria group bacterium UBA2163]